jgi:hypothetical protein
MTFQIPETHHDPIEARAGSLVWMTARIPSTGTHHDPIEAPSKCHQSRIK